MIGKQKTEVGLTAEQAFEIALHALKRKMYTQASAWLLAVLDMHENSKSTLNKTTVTDAISALIREVALSPINQHINNLEFCRF